MDSHTPAPADDPRFIEVDGHRLLRVMGGDGSEETQTETPAPETTTPTPPEGQVENAGPFEERFDPAALPEELRPGWNQLRADYTRKTQELAEQRKETEAIIEFAAALQNPETRAQALKHLGLEIETEEEGGQEFSLEDPNEERLSAIEQALVSSQEHAQATQYQQALEEYVDTQFDELEGNTGRKFSDEELNTLEALAHALPDEQGLPSIANAYTRLYEQVWPKVLDNYTESKRQAAIAPQGQSGSKKIDLKDPETRVRHMAETAKALMS